ncbi:MAG TPA: hypothetical protein VFU15_12275, partial [Bacteroidia bacterium]|nr:hypothetical protein [Bacteroidia bacterium]
MKPADSIPNTDRINYLNIGLILISCAVAFFVPFELFLFSYAVLGPAHYLTEISWLHERNYFSKGKYNYVFLVVAGFLLFLVLYFDKLFPHVHLFNRDANLQTGMTTGLVYIAFVSALAMVVLKKPFHRLIAFIVIVASASLAKQGVLLFSVFLPTLIHVYLFTGLFMLYGALKSRSKSGYLSVAIFVLCPLLFVFITPSGMPVSDYALHSYSLFETVNRKFLEVFQPDLFVKDFTSLADYRQYLHKVIYESNAGLMVMRFIAFAYTYHYLNWFSKTSVIKWHNVPKRRLVVIGVLWAAAVAFYFWKYEYGFHVLFLLSFLHVFLEFPLNHVTIIGIFK